MDLPGKPLGILRIRHAVLDQLRIPGNGGQRRLQLVGYVGRELLAHLGAFYDVVVLLPDGGHKGLQFPVHHLLAGIGNIPGHFLNGAHQGLCKIIGQKDTEDKQHQGHLQHRGQHILKDCEEAVRLSGDP